MQRIYEVLIKGKGGHASMPHKANNPILIAAGLISQLCVMPAVILSHHDEAGVKVIGFEAGDKGNIIPEQSKIQLVIYAEEEKLLLKMQERYLDFSEKFIKARSAESTIYEI